MSGIENKEAYFRTVVKNMDKNEFRSNDNFYHHISSVGDERDIQAMLASNRTAPASTEIEQGLAESSLENWLGYMENEKLLEAIRSLSQINQTILFLIFVRGLTQRECADILGIRQQSIHERIGRSLCRIKKYF